MKETRVVHELDAANQAPGRLAAKIAMILRGKNKADFDPAKANGDAVRVINVSQLKFTGRKLVQKDYRHHSMFPGGLKTVSMKKIFEADPADVIRRAVYGMLPKNKHRDEWMKRLRITG